MATKRKHKRALILEGSEAPGGNSIYCYHGKFSPFAVFDAELQDWITGDLRWRWQARFMFWWHGGGWI